MTIEWTDEQQRAYRAGRLEVLHDDARYAWLKYATFVKMLRKLGELPAKPEKKK